MPQSIPLNAIPNQSFSALLDNQRYVVTIKTIANGVTIASVSINGALVVDSVRCVANRLMIPYRYLEGAGGNFFLGSDGDTLPDYTQFGVTQTLYYFTNAELVALRAAAVTT